VLQVSLVHGLASSQLGGVPAWQTPAWQVSAPLQALPSEHEVPVCGACWQPSCVSQLSVVHELLSLQSAAVVQGTQPLMGVPVQLPFWQWSAFVQMLPSSQVVPFVAGACEQVPVPVLQVSTVQGLRSLQLMGVPPAQAPAWQVSLPLQRFPSGHGVPSATATCEHEPPGAIQESVVQGLLSSQLGGVPAVQRPPWQVSAPLQALPSEHDVPFVTAVCVQPPVWVSHESAVHGLPSSQLMGVPAAQLPA